MFRVRKWVRMREVFKWRLQGGCKQPWFKLEKPVILEFIWCVTSSDLFCQIPGVPAYTWYGSSHPISILQKLILNLTNPAVRHKKIIFLNLFAISPCFLSWWVAKLIKMIYYNNGIWNNMKNFNYLIENNQAKHWCVFCKINYTLKLCFLKSTESH